MLSKLKPAFIKLKKLKKHMPAITAGVCCWIFLWVFTGASCFIRAAFGIPCPGCGSTRAIGALCHGDIKKALEFHPLIFITLALIAACIFAFIFKINIFGTAEKKKKRAAVFAWCVFALYMGVYITRMILFYPNAEPMTYLDVSMLGRVINFVKIFLKI